MHRTTINDDDDDAVQVEFTETNALDEDRSTSAAASNISHAGHGAESTSFLSVMALQAHQHAKIKKVIFILFYYLFVVFLILFAYLRTLCSVWQKQIMPTHGRRFP